MNTFATRIRRFQTGITAAALFAATPLAVAEFKPGDKLPDFQLPSSNGEQVTLAREGEQLVLTEAQEQVKPKAVVVHLLQPDCLQCRAQLTELQALHGRYQQQEVAVLGIAHRGEMKDAAQLRQSLSLPFRILHGSGSPLATQFAAGDTLGIADQTGTIRYAQVGYGKGDEALWAKAIDEILAGKPVSQPTVTRERLAVGDRLPAIELPDVMGGKPMALHGQDGRLIFRGPEGKDTHPKGAIGFFSRYWAFSREEMVHLQKFHEKYAGQGLQVFVVSMHPKTAEAQKLNRELKVTYPVFNGHESDLGKHYAYG